MANPFLAEGSLHTPTGITDHMGDDLYHDTVHYNVAGILVVALVILVLMKVSGFRAVVGLGRG